MKSMLTPLLAAAVFFFVTFTGLTVQHESDTFTRRHRFAVELQKCQDAAAAGPNVAKCDLFGKVKFVTSFPDVRVQAVSSFPDIKVKMVSNFADSPGEWQVVQRFPDYKVQFVNSFPDYKIKFVSSFPGCE